MNDDFIVLFEDKLINIKQLLYVQPVKKGKLYIAVFTTEQKMWLQPEEGIELMRILSKKSKKPKERTILQ